MNIPEMLMKYLANSDTLNSISSAVGLGREETSKAVSASVPALLAALTQTASSTQGAQQLANAVAQQDTGLLDNISGNISAKGGQIAQQGSSLLSSILGGSQISTISSILSRFVGVGEGAIGKILGMLGPIVLGFLGRQSAGLGASGLSNLLLSQKDHIRSAMPSGLASMLSSGIPGLGDIIGTSKQYAEPTTAASSRNVYERPVVASSPARWLVPSLVALALLALLAMWARRGKVPEETVAVRTPATQRNTTPEAVGAPVRSATGVATSENFVSETSRLVSEATKALTDVRDTTSANAAIDKLKDINARLDSSRSVWTSLPDSTRTLAQSTLTPLVTRLESAAQPVLNMPAVGDMIRPQVNELLKNLRTYTTAGPPL